MNKIKLFIVIVLLCIVGVIAVKESKFLQKNMIITDNANLQNDGDMEISKPHELTIESLRNGEYPGSDIVIEQTLTPGNNYQRYIASYTSEGLKIYALLTVPNGAKPESGWPVILFNHGYIAPLEYKTTERYLAYTDAFSRNGYIVFALITADTAIPRGRQRAVTDQTGIQSIYLMPSRQLKNLKMQIQTESACGGIPWADLSPSVRWSQAKT